VDDPDNLGRIRVSLPTYENVETDWMEVLSAGAGAGKGLVMVPDVGDQVLVLFTHGDPSEGIVLGGVYGVKQLPDSVISGGKVRQFTLLTPGGQRLRLDDEHGIIRFGNSSNSFLEMSPNQVTVHAAVDMVLTAPGKNVTIRGKNIDFERE
jgi:uncharacterized protein involved in type VI secretion and phage assembly